MSARKSPQSIRYRGALYRREEKSCMQVHTASQLSQQVDNALGDLRSLAEDSRSGETALRVLKRRLQDISRKDTPLFTERLETLEEAVRSVSTDLDAVTWLVNRFVRGYKLVGAEVELGRRDSRWRSRP